jgi:hypothetical protein
MCSPCMMEKDYPNRKEMGNNIQSQRRRDIPNPSRILLVPKTLHIPKRRRRESSELIAINQIMKNTHA